MLEYDPDAEAAKSKIAGQSGSNEVAQNEMTGELVKSWQVWLFFICLTCKGTFNPVSDDAPVYVDPPVQQNDYAEPPQDYSQTNQGKLPLAIMK